MKDIRRLDSQIANALVDKIFNKKDHEMYIYLDSILNSMHDGIYITDKKGSTLYVNKSYERMSDLDREDLLGKNMRDLIKDDYFRESASLRVIKENKKISIIDKFKNGKRCLVTSNPVYDSGNNLILIVTNLRDMSDLKDIEEKIKLMEDLNMKYLNEIRELRNENLNRENIIGNSKSMQKVYEMIGKVSEVDTTVLIFGETGVGKEVVAKEIHKRSPRKNEPFIKVNCASIPESLFESELFGYEKGAFTGAISKGKPGLFELANGGTILLDEIGEISLNCQAKLLRIIQEKQINRLGGTVSKEIDVRVIASTNKDLLQLVKEGTFREDLYYRLSVIPLRIPALRERKEDIVIFTMNFLEVFNDKFSVNKKINYKAYDLMKSYYWPGNVRQLKNLVERLVLICPQDEINCEYIEYLALQNNSITDQLHENSFKLKEVVENTEKETISKALRKHGTTRKAAEALGVSQPTVVRKANKYKITLSDT